MNCYWCGQLGNYCPETERVECRGCAVLLQAIATRPAAALRMALHIKAQQALNNARDRLEDMAVEPVDEPIGKQGQPLAPGDGARCSICKTVVKVVNPAIGLCTTCPHHPQALIERFTPED